MNPVFVSCPVVNTGFLNIGTAQPLAIMAAPSLTTKIRSFLWRSVLSSLGSRSVEHSDRIYLPTRRPMSMNGSMMPSFYARGPGDVVPAQLELDMKAL